MELLYLITEAENLVTQTAGYIVSCRQTEVGWTCGHCDILFRVCLEINL